GGDVRKSFIQFLYEGLADSGIYTFIDYNGIEIGEGIMDKIFQVIQHSEICIPIFSKDFASSKICLKEVEKMVECHRTIMPIFYDVSPSVVGKEEENYQQSFCTHAAKGVESATINNWKKALQIVSRMRGWELAKFNHGEHELINEVVSTVRRLLRKDDLCVTADLVGMDHPVQELMKKLDVSYENGEVIEGQTLTGIRVVEISGLPGIGKSTLAKVVYNKIHHLFECKKFLQDIHGEVEQRRVVSLQEDLISGLQKKTYTLKSPAEGTEFIKYRFRDLRVLIILDNVSDFKQINSLAGDPRWFGQGSRIIVVSMRSNLVDKYSQVRVTSRSSSIVNSCDDILIENYELKQMCNDHAFELFCRHASSEKPLQEEFSSLAWDIILAAGGIPLVIEVVGSFLHGKTIEFWKEALGRLKREPYDEEVKRILKRRYDDLDKYAQEIFLDITCFFVGKDKTIPSYMWEACKYDPYRGIDELHNMSLVKTRENNELWVHNQLEVLGREIVKEENPSEPFKRSRLWDQEDIELLLKERKDGQDAAVEALSATFDKPHLFLERRFFHGFSKLRSISKLRNLVSLDIKFCSFVQELPKDIGSLEALTELYIDGTSIREFPEGSYGKLEILSACNCKSLSLSNSIGNLKSLLYLALDNTELRELPDSICLLENLRTLSLRNCRRLWKLPDSIGDLKELRVMDLSDALVNELPLSVQDWRKLKVLKMPHTFIREFPEGTKNLERLEEIDFSGCQSLTGECDITGLSSLR
ncbi:hypothetical protein EUGRSUZ_G00357, partial [Eucalyptus grandis]